MFCQSEPVRFEMSAPQFAPLPEPPVTRESLLAWLDASDVNVITTEHPPLFTVEDSRALRGELTGGHTKNLFLKDKKSKYFLLTAQEDTDINLKTIHRLLGGSGRVSFGRPDALNAILGVTPGSVTAFGLINDREGRIAFAIDRRLLEHVTINCHPLTNEATTAIARDDLLAFASATGHEPLVVDLSGEG